MLSPRDPFVALSRDDVRRIEAAVGRVRASLDRLNKAPIPLKAKTQTIDVKFDVVDLGTVVWLAERALAQERR